MHAKKLLATLIGALAIGLTVTPAGALTGPGFDDDHGGGLVIRHLCSTFDDEGRTVLWSGRSFWCLGEESDDEVDDGFVLWPWIVECADDEPVLAVGDRLLVLRAGHWFQCAEEEDEGDEGVFAGHNAEEEEDDEGGTSTVTAVNTAVLGTALAVDNSEDVDASTVTALNSGFLGTAVAVSSAEEVDSSSVTAVNSGFLGTAVAASNAEEVDTSTVTAVNTGFLGTAVAVENAAEVDTSQVTAVNTAVLGTAIAVNNAEDVDNSSVTAVNTGILGTAIAVGGGGAEVDQSGFGADEVSNLGSAVNAGAGDFAGDVLSSSLAGVAVPVGSGRT